MSFNGIIGANCISKIFRDRLMDNLKEDAENDLQLSVLLDTLEKLPDCSKLIEGGGKPLEPGKMQISSGELVEIPKKKRVLSEYQKFMSICAKKENGKSFSECVLVWREQKSKNKSS